MNVRVLVVLSLLSGCGDVSTSEPGLSLVARPIVIIGDAGAESDIVVSAADEYQRPGVGSVRLTAPYGSFGTQGRVVDLPLDAAGTVTTVWTCNYRADESCLGLTELVATWDFKSASNSKLDAQLQGLRKVLISGCVSPDAGSPEIQRACASPTSNECDGQVDAFLAAEGASARLNASGGNGFDDDCDGVVDEGCSCSTPGEFKDCWLVPATQVEATTGLPVNWCSTNAKGVVTCAPASNPVWSGLCAGAEAPSVHDTCEQGDFNCDGLQGNNDENGCVCY